MFFKKTNNVLQNKKLLFVIGFNKTGTTSIHRLFQQNGFKSVHWDEGRLAKKMLNNVCNGDPVLMGYDDKFDIYSDIVFRTSSFHFEGNSLFKQLYYDYPESYFLYNTRDMDKWLESRVNHPNIVYGMTEFQLQQKLLNTTDEEKIKSYWKTQRLRFEEDINLFFKDTGRLLTLDIADINFVEKLTTFTGFKINSTFWEQHNKT